MIAHSISYFTLANLCLQSVIWEFVHHTPYFPLFTFKIVVNHCAVTFTERQKQCGDHHHTHTHNKTKQDQTKTSNIVLPVF